jgi:hypothetical protein
MNILAVWFLATAFAIAAALIWSFAPILVPMIAIGLGLGVLVAAVIRLARRIERHRGQR